MKIITKRVAHIATSFLLVFGIAFSSVLNAVTVQAAVVEPPTDVQAAYSDTMPSIHLTWAVAAGSVGYIIDVRESGTSTWYEAYTLDDEDLVTIVTNGVSTSADIAGTATGASPVALTGGETYDVSIKSNGGASSSAAVLVQNVEFLDGGQGDGTVFATAPNSVSASYNATDKVINTTWAAPSTQGSPAISGYRVQLFGQSSIEGSHTKDASTFSDSFAITTAGTYTVRVTAINGVAGPSPSDAAANPIVVAFETIEYSGNQPTEDVTVATNTIGVLDGVRDNITVSGGILKGTGSANTVTVASGAMIAPGHSPGTLTILETASLTGIYEAEILNATTYDQLRVGENYNSGGNAVTLNSGAALSVVLYDGWAVTQGNQFRVIDNRSQTAVSGTFSGMAEGSQFVVTNEGLNITFSITYVGGDGNDIVLTALNTGTDPTPPNTGVAQMILGNPAIVAVLGAITAITLIAIAVRRRATN